MRTLLLSLLLAASFLVAAQHRILDPVTQKWGYEDAEYNVILPAIYDELQPFFDTIMTVKKDGKMGVIDDKGNFRIPMVYEMILSWAPQFRSQFGYFQVSRQAKVPNTWGIVDSRGKVILPEKFQYVRALTPNLLVGIVNPDTMLQFFNLKGKLLYKIPGRSVEPNNIDNSSFLVFGKDRKQRGMKLDGSWVYPADPSAGIWTDGKLTILHRGEKLGVINQKGETVVPFEYFKITLGVEGQFVVEKLNEKYEFEGMGVYDKTGKVVIPVGDYGLVAFGEIYIARHKKKDLQGIFYSDGMDALQMEYRISPYGISESDYGKNIPDSHPEQYLRVQTTAEPYTQFLVKDDGKMFMLKGAQNIDYYSEKHPLIVTMKPTAGDTFSKQKVVSRDGKDLTEAIYFRLDFTPNPRVFLAMTSSPAEKRGCGFLYLDAPEKSQLDIGFPVRWRNGYYQTTKNYSLHQLFDPAIKLVYEGEYPSFIEPQKEHLQQFRADKQVKGRLVAVAFKPGMTQDNWIGINEKGKVFQFKSLKSNAENQAEVDKILNEERDIAGEEALEPVLEGIPIVEEAPHPIQPAGDEVFNVVELNPAFTGGEAALQAFLKKNLNYPPNAKENGAQGTVFVSFIVEKDGSLSEVRILRGANKDLDMEALRLVKSMPNWTPGQQRARVVRAKYTLPVKFALE